MGAPLILDRPPVAPPPSAIGPRRYAFGRVGAGDRFGRLGSQGGGGAAPAVQEWSIVGLVNTSVLAGTGTLSQALPVGTTTGDVVIVLLVCDFVLAQTVPGGGGGNGGINTTGYAALQLGADNSPGYHSGYKVMGEMPDTTVVINREGSNNQMAMCILVVRGADPDNPIDNSVSESGTGASGDPNPPSHTTITGNAMRVAMGGLDDDAASVSAAPTDFENLISATAGGSNRSTAMMATKIEPTAGALDPNAFTTSGDDNWKATHFALRPAIT